MMNMIELKCMKKDGFIYCYTAIAFSSRNIGGKLKTKTNEKYEMTTDEAKK